MPTILGANSVSGYEVANSGNFGSDGMFLTRSQSDNESDTDRRKFTISGWYKQTFQGSASGWNGFWSAAADGNNYTSLKKNNNTLGNSRLIFGLKISGTEVTFTTTQEFRDPTSWFNIVCAFDSTDGTAADRFKLYVNGERAAGAFSADITQNVSAHWGDDASAGRVGAYNNNSGGSYMHNGYMADVAMTVGYAHGPDKFGETDSNGFWIPKNPAISYSANGFKLEFKQTGASANASGFGADTSGNTNHFTIDNDDGDIAYGGGKTDTPTNNFNVLNPFAINRDKPIIGVSQGGLVPFDTQNDAHRIIGSIMCFAKGKWYMECKYSGGTNEVTFGILDVDNRYANQAWYTAGGSFPGDISDGNSFGYRQDGNLFTNGNTTSGKTTWASNGDFLGLAIDCDNNAIYAHVNGTYVDSGDPTSGASKTGSLSNFQQTGFMMPAVSVKATSYNGAYVNFGSPANDDSGVTNSNADANGYGKFQYAVPSGYFALCTKNLAEYG